MAALGLSNLPGWVLRNERMEVRLAAWGATSEFLFLYGRGEGAVLMAVEQPASGWQSC